MRKIFALITLPVLLGSMTGETVAKASCRIETLAGTYIISASGTDGGSFFAYAGMIAYDGKGGYRVRIRFGGPSQETKQDHGTYTLVGPCEVEAISVNAGVNLQQFSGVKVQHGCRQEGPRYIGGLLA